METETESYVRGIPSTPQPMLKINYRVRIDPLNYPQHRW